MNLTSSSDLFLFEPFNASAYPKFFVQGGFQIAETYISGFRTNYEDILQCAEKGYHAAIQAGFEIRSIDITRFEEELKIFHELSIEIFKNSWSFVPISFDEFKQLYIDVKERLDPRYCHFISEHGREVGFCFSIPDFLSPERALILKTIGVLPSYQNKNVGSALIYQQHQQAKEDGYQKIIYALIREGNVASKIQPYGATVFRKYEAYELKI